MNRTYLIKPDELLKEYSMNDKLRKLLDMGSFVYVEEMLVLNDLKYVAYKNGLPWLTDFDREELPKCALSFNVSQLSFTGKKDSFGKEDALQTKRLATGDDMEIQSDSAFSERQKKVYLFISTIQGLNCWDMIRKFLEFVKQEKIIYDDNDIGTDSDIFCNRTNLGEYYYKRIMGTMDRTEAIKKEAVIAFAAGYELYADMAEIFLKSAGHSLSLSLKDDVCYRLVLNTKTQSPIDVKNAELDKYGGKKLGSKQ